MASVEPSILSPISIGQNFSTTVTVVPGTLEIITSVTGTLTGTPVESGITITSGTSSVIISGKHENTFTDVFQYTEPGETDLTVAPTTVTSRGNVPPSKNLFDLNQDKRKSETRTYELVINGSQTLTVTQEVLNPLEAMRQFMSDYDYKGI